MKSKNVTQPKYACHAMRPVHGRMLTLEWRSGKRRVLPWARLIDADNTPMQRLIILRY